MGGRRGDQVKLHLEFSLFSPGALAEAGGGGGGGGARRCSRPERSKTAKSEDQNY